MELTYVLRCYFYGLRFLLPLLSTIILFSYLYFRIVYLSRNSIIISTRVFLQAISWVRYLAKNHEPELFNYSELKMQNSWYIFFFLSLKHYFIILIYVGNNYCYNNSRLASQQVSIVNRILQVISILVICTILMNVYYVYSIL